MNLKRLVILVTFIAIAFGQTCFAKAPKSKEVLQQNAQDLIDNNAAYLRLMVIGNIWAMAAKYQLFAQHIERLDTIKFDGNLCVDPQKSYWGCPYLLDLHDIYADVEQDLEAYLHAHKRPSKVEKTEKDWREIRMSEQKFNNLKDLLKTMLREGQGLLKKELDRASQAVPGSTK